MFLFLLAYKHFFEKGLSLELSEGIKIRHDIVTGGGLAEPQWLHLASHCVMKFVQRLLGV